jgi:hypothetical protein
VCRPIVVAETSDIVIHIPEDFAYQGARCALYYMPGNPHFVSLFSKRMVFVERNLECKCGSILVICSVVIVVVMVSPANCQQISRASLCHRRTSC